MRTGIKNFFYKLTHWETWHYHAKYIPILPAWIWYCLKSRSLWFFTSSNPTLTFGGMEGESKEEMYRQLPPGTYPNSIYVSPTCSFAELEKEIAENKLKYPFAVKPNVGMMGFMFRKIESPDDLRKYHNKIPVNYVVQDLIEYPLEVSVFYYRLPYERKGTISGFLKKESPYVTGDGHSTLWELIKQYPGVRFKLDQMRTRHVKKLQDIIPKDEKYLLSDAANRSQGGNFVGLQQEIDEKLLDIFDEISHYSGHFYYGRYDIKCVSVEDLKQRKNYSILEYNGSGSGTQQVYGNGNSLFQAIRIILQHWKMLYKISKYNNDNGIPYWKFWTGWKFLLNAKKNLKMLKQLDAEFPSF
ncbi:MAG: hypothetical protein WKF35_02140 [Ferruginibacter sp.]